MAEIAVDNKWVEISMIFPVIQRSFNFIAFNAKKRKERRRKKLRFRVSTVQWPKKSEKMNKKKYKQAKWYWKHSFVFGGNMASIGQRIQVGSFSKTVCCLRTVRIRHPFARLHVYVGVVELQSEYMEFMCMCACAWMCVCVCTFECDFFIHFGCNLSIASMPTFCAV